MPLSSRLSAESRTDTRVKKLVASGSILVRLIELLNARLVLLRFYWQYFMQQTFIDLNRKGSSRIDLVTFGILFF